MSRKQAEIWCPPLANSYHQPCCCIGRKQGEATKQTMGEEEAGNRKHASVDLLFLKITSNFFILLAMRSGVHTPLKKWGSHLKSDWVCDYSNQQTIPEVTLWNFQDHAASTRFPWATCSRGTLSGRCHVSLTTLRPPHLRTTCRRSGQQSSLSSQPHPASTASHATEPSGTSSPAEPRVNAPRQQLTATSWEIPSQLIPQFLTQNHEKSINNMVGLKAYQFGENK